MLSTMYAYVRALSLDVVLGAVVCCAFLGRLLQVHIPGAVYWCLALAVWVVYTLDHLWDAYRLQERARSFRHRYHYRHFNVLMVLVAVGILAGILISRHLPEMVLTWGSIISALVCGYFILMMFLGTAVKYFKEIIVSLVYATGVFTAPITMSPHPIEGWLVLMFLQFTLLAMVNLLEFSYFEMEQDQLHKFGSAVISWGKKQTRRVVAIAIILVVSLSAFSFMIWPHIPAVVEAQLTFMVMALMLGLIILLPDFFKDRERFRVLGDGIFLIPAIFLL